MLMEKDTATIKCPICGATRNGKGRAFKSHRNMLDHKQSHFPTEREEDDLPFGKDDYRRDILDLFSDESDGVYWGMAFELGY